MAPEPGQPTPPVPDPELMPKPSAQMAAEGEREGEVLVERDHSQSAPEDDGVPSRNPPIIAPNGD